MLAAFHRFGVLDRICPPKRLLCSTICSLDWGQSARILLAQMAGWWATCLPQGLLAFNLSSPAHNTSLQWKQHWRRSVLAPLQFTLCQSITGGWMEKNVPPQTSNFCPKWSEMGSVWQQIFCKDNNFLRFWEKYLLLPINKLLFQVIEHC